MPPSVPSGPGSPTAPRGGGAHPLPHRRCNGTARRTASPPPARLAAVSMGTEGRLPAEANGGAHWLPPAGEGRVDGGTAQSEGRPPLRPRPGDLRWRRQFPAGLSQAEAVAAARTWRRAAPAAPAPPPPPLPSASPRPSPSPTAATATRRGGPTATRRERTSSPAP